MIYHTKKLISQIIFQIFPARIYVALFVATATTVSSLPTVQSTCKLAEDLWYASVEIPMVAVWPISFDKTWAENGQTAINLHIWDVSGFCPLVVVILERECLGQLIKCLWYGSRLLLPSSSAMCRPRHFAYRFPWQVPTLLQHRLHGTSRASMPAYIAGASVET